MGRGSLLLGREAVSETGFLANRLKLAEILAETPLLQKPGF
jgi:hypothetical protein